ncbi:hypothetical protein [Escherichia phage phiWec190]|nr:hypothetical protein [Escherichia phage phiWec188]BDU13624.1 hypothetical protein [Escherichia phage phiWec190]
MRIACVADVTTTTPVPCTPMECPYCGGLGYVMVDVGQLYECNPCKTTGYLPMIEENVYEPKRKD